MSTLKPVSPIDEAQTEFNLQRASRVVEEARGLLQIKEPEQIAAENAIARQTGLPPEMAARLDKFQVNLATKAPAPERVRQHAVQEPDFVAAVDETEALKEAPDKYEDFYTIWTLGRQLKGMASDVADAFRTGAEDKDLGEERAAVGNEQSNARLRGEQPSEEILQKRTALDKRAMAAGELKPLSPTGAIRVSTMAGLQSLDGLMIDTETTDALAHRIFPEAIAEKIDGRGGPAEKLFTGLYALAAGVSLPTTVRANMAYESYWLEKGNMLYSLQQIEDESGQEIDPELTETIATYYGLIASGVEVASTFVGFPIVGRASAAVKSMIFRKTVDALKTPTVAKAAGSIIKDILFGSLAESGEEGAQFAAESIATESWKLLSGKFKETSSFEDVVDAFMSPENLQELKVNMQAGFVGGLGLGSIGGAIRGVGMVDDARRHQENQKAFVALAKGIEETDLRERGSGELVAALASRAGAGKVDTIYIDPDQLSEIFNQQGIKDANRVIEGLADEIANAQTEMRPVQMDAGTFATRLAGSTLFDELKDHIRYSKDDRSNFEIKADRELAQETEKTVLEEMEKSDRELFEKSSQKVREEFESKILEIGRNTAQESRANAAVFEGIYRSIATALTVSQKRLVTPEEVLRIHQPLEFQGPDSKAQPAGQPAEETFAQTKLRAAVRVDGVVFQGDTHAAAADAAVKSGAFSQISDATTLDELIASRDDNKPEFFNERGGHRLWDDQGFVDEGGNWLERDEALALTGSDNSGGLAPDSSSAPSAPVAPEPAAMPRVESNVNFDVDKDAPIRADATPPPSRDLLRWLPGRTKAGKLLGVPEDVKTIEQWRARHNFVKQLVIEGLAGRYWYEDSGDAVLVMVGGNFVEAERFIQLLAIYSPQAKVDVNTMMAVRAYTQWRMGVPREQFKVNSGAKDAKAISVLYDGQPFEGRKTNSFYMNLMHRIVERATDAQLAAMKIDPDLLRDIKRPVTSDMWVFRAYGYASDAAAGGKGNDRYSVTETDMNRIAAELNEELPPGAEPWLPHQVQAAMWTAIKARFENQQAKDATNAESLKKGYSFFNDEGKLSRKTGAENTRKHIAIWRKHALRVSPEEVAKGIERDAFSFADVLARMTFAVTWEAIPAPVFDHPISRATPEQQLEFQAAAAQIIIDEDGFDGAAGRAGAGVVWSIEGDGGFEAALASNYIARLIPNKPKGDFSTAETDIYSRMIQYIYKQKAVPWFRADNRLSMKGSILVQVRNEEDAAPKKRKGKAKPKKKPEFRTLRKFDTVKAARAFAEKDPGKRFVVGKPQSLGVAFRYAKALTRAELDAAFTEMRAIFGDQVGFTKTAPDEISVVNYRGGEGSLPFLMDDDEFLEKANEFGKRSGAEGDVRFGVQSDYGPVHDWAADPAGEGLLQQGSLAGRPDLHPWLRDRRAAFEDLLVETARTLGDPGYVALETFNQLRNRGADQGGSEGGADLGWLGLLNDAGGGISLADLHKGTKTTDETERAIYRSVGMDVLQNGGNTRQSLKIYRLTEAFGDTVESVMAKYQPWLDREGWQIRLFGPKNGDRPTYFPDFSDPNTPSYEQGVVWLFDPALEEGSFRDHAYTLAWRIAHEIAHGRVNDKLTAKYGGRGRRAGAMGVEIKGPYFKGGAPLTLADGMRAVEWEYETFIEQRKILAELGVEITDEEFRLENSINLSDAMIRVITGQFGNPGEVGVVPTNIEPKGLLENCFNVLRKISAIINGDTREVLNQPAYHGTPHIFDRFDLTKIGTGEGVQIFGWGLYFSSARGIAEFYRESLSGRGSALFRGEPIKNISAMAKKLVDNDEVSSYYGSIEATRLTKIFLSQMRRSKDYKSAMSDMQRRIELLSNRVEENRRSGRVSPFAERELQDVVRARELGSVHFTEEDFSLPPLAGQLVQAEIPDSENLLDWDEPLNDQPEMLEKLLAAAGVNEAEAIAAFKASGRQLGKSLNGTSEDRDAALRQSNSPAVKLGEAIGQKSQNHDGQGFYRGLSRYLGSDKAASQWLLAAGIPGMKYKAGQMSGVDAEEATNFVIWEESAIDIVERQMMRLDGEVQGQYERNAAGSIIRMTKASDLTTLLHEAAHFYLSTISQMVRNGTADDRIRADLEAVLRYTGVSTAADLTLPYADGRQWNGRVDMPHEVFARSFEAYLAEGKAPSKEMRGVFRRFRSWMAGVYGSLKEVARRLGVQLTPEIRGVFDRMLAVDDAMRESEEMKPLFESREDAGMSEAQWEAYLESFAEIRDEARDRVMRPLVRRVTAEKKRQRRELADSLYDRFAEEVDQEPVYRALRFLRAEEQVEGLEGDGLSRDAILALYARPEAAAKVLASVPRGTVQRTGGHDPAMIADLFGFNSPSALLQALANVQPREKEIARRVDAEIASRPEFFEREIEIEAKSLVGGEELAKRIRIELQGLRELAKTTLLPGARRAVAEVGAPPAGASRARVLAAQEALDAAQARGNSEAIARAQVELVAAEATATAEREARAQQAGGRRRAREIESVLNDQAIRERAETLIANRPAGDLRGDRKVWVDRMRKEQKAAREMVAARDYLAAMRAMERAALLNAMIVEADKAIARQPKILTHARGFDTKKQRDKLRTAGAATELGLIDLLLEKYDLRTDVPIDPALRGPDRVREIARRRKEQAQDRKAARTEEFPSLEKWMAEKKSELEVVAIDESLFLRPDRRHWKELTVAELDGLHATLLNMEQIAKNEVRSSKAALKQKYTDMADGAVVAMTLKNANRTARDRREDNLWRGNMRRTIDTFDAFHINMKRLFRWMGGDDEATNPLLTIERWWRDATAYELERLDGLNRKYMELIQSLYRSGKDYRSMIDVPAFGEPMTRAQAIAFALNAGTTSNWSKLLRGYKMVNGDQLDEARGNKVLEVLSDEEWTFVQSVWDLVNSLWDEASENHFQMTGVRPEKVEAREFITPTGRVMKGGYFPLAYDPLKSDAVARVKERGQLVSLFEHYASDPRTKHGFLEKRKDKFAAPVLLDLDVIATHLADVVHDIAWRKPLRDSWKVLHQPQLKSAIVDMYGIEYFDAIEHRIRMLAGAQSSMIKNLKWMQNGLQKFQSAQTAYMLAGAFSTTFVQLSSFTNAIPRIADGNVREGTGLIAKGLWLVVTDFKATKAKIHTMSALMRHRAKAMDTSVREANAELEGRTDRIAKARRLGYSMIAAADYFVSGSVFLARYEKVLSETMDTDRAMREAEFAVERTQGAGNVKDMAQIQDADPLLRPFTMFYSYFSAFYQELHSMAEDASEGKIKKAASAYLLIAVIPGMLSDLIRFNVPDEDDEDEQAKAWALWAAYHLFANPFSSVILMRDVANFAASKISGRAFGGFEPTPLVGFFDQMARTIETIGSAVGSDDDINPYEVAEEITAGVGMSMGLPFARQLNIIANNLAIAHDEGLELGMKDLLVRRRKSE